ncbi:hypothetical protein CSQ88_07145 [Iodobacter sp. BJB302]|nr:hypothetical protein CSQ88_07145 [Iodobacter sp. BJB302]
MMLVSPCLKRSAQTGNPLSAISAAQPASTKNQGLKNHRIVLTEDLKPASHRQVTYYQVF